MPAPHHPGHPVPPVIVLQLVGNLATIKQQLCPTPEKRRSLSPASSAARSEPDRLHNRFGQKCFRRSSSVIREPRRVPAKQRYGACTDGDSPVGRISFRLHASPAPRPRHYQHYIPVVPDCLLGRADAINLHLRADDGASESLYARRI